MAEEPQDSAAEAKKEGDQKEPDEPQDSTEVRQIDNGEEHAGNKMVDPVVSPTTDKTTTDDYVDLGSPAASPAKEDNSNAMESVDEDNQEKEENLSEKVEDEAENPPLTNDNVNTEKAVEEDPEKLRALEEMHLGTATEVLFPSTPSSGGWDNLRWMSLSGSRQISFSRVVFRRTKEQFKIFSLIKSNVSILFPARLLVIYQKPAILLLLRRANDLEELSQYTALDYETEADPSSFESILKHYWIAESVVELATTKLRLSALTTHHASQIVENIKHERERSVFEILSPTESQIIVSAVQVRENTRDRQELSFTDSGAFMETTTTESALVQAICEAHGAAHDAIWKHQVILGTLHSFVLSGHTKLLEEALERCWRHLNNIGSGTVDKEEENELLGRPRVLPERVIDAADDSGRPPMYYACNQSMNDAMALLIRYGANPGYQTPEPDCESLLHICARKRNFKGLTTLLSIHSRPGCQPNVANGLGYTPLYTAIVLGRSLPGSVDLETCIQVLKSNGGSLFSAVDVVSTQLAHPLLVLALDYRDHDLAVLLEHLDFSFPLSGNLDLVMRTTAGSVKVDGQSLASIHKFPVHQMLAKLHQQVRSGVDIASQKENIVRTLRLLLRCGFEPNERLETMESAVPTHEETDSGIAHFVGFAPIQILAVTALELEKVGPIVSESLYGEFDAIVSLLAEELVKHGARLSLDPPPFERRRSKASSPRKQASSSAFEEQGAADTTSNIDHIDRSGLNIDANDHLLHLLGGKEQLKKARSAFTDLGPVMLGPSYAPKRDDSSSIEDSDVPGGSSEKSCAICWKSFTLMNRKHRCRISWRHVCDECSGKRMLVESKDYRISDGQFTRARAFLEKQASKPTLRQSSARSRASSSVSASEKSQARLQRLEAEEKANRDSLFGGDVMEQATNFLFGTESEKEPADEVNGLAKSLGETRNALLERGDKLSSLNDKTAEMVSASEDFANLATQLRKQSERGFFGF